MPKVHKKASIVNVTNSICLAQESIQIVNHLCSVTNTKCQPNIIG